MLQDACDCYLATLGSSYILVKSFAFQWVDPRDTPRELLFMTNKNVNYPKPLGKGHKINEK